MEQWLYDRLNENLIIVLLAGFAGFEMVRRLLKYLFDLFEKTTAVATVVGYRASQLALSILAAQTANAIAVTRFAENKFAQNKFAKEEVAAWPEPTFTDEFPIDIELDRKGELKIELPLPVSSPSLRLCSGDCSGL